MSQVSKRATARRDLVQHYIYLAEQAGVETADRFLMKAEETFFDLAQMPAIGVGLPVRPEALKGLRKWQVKEFERFLIFYQPRETGICIVRVLYGTRDWWSLLGIE
ncbi:MAG: type II toxin-antitoxin system RelE/ParE family toxin [Acidobacteriia bacterium]|nr:type II toxin-antitoxin system RelE/ParE family toxin [Terriglobia bacterium]